jgi:hypothetical protein
MRDLGQPTTFDINRNWKDMGMESMVHSGQCSSARFRFHSEGSAARSRVSLMERGKWGDVVRKQVFCVIYIGVL